MNKLHPSIFFCALLAVGSVGNAELRTNPLDANRAYGYLNAICDIGPRISGSDGMRQQQQLLLKHFQPLTETKITQQKFLARNPLGKAKPKVPITNLIVQWNPQARKRLMVCAHYDTRPLPDRDPNPRARRSGTFIGANDGGSGTALLMELANHHEQFQGPLGVDFVLFDGEELVYNERRDRYFLGSIGFSQQYKKGKHPGGGKYLYAVLVDMVGDADLKIFQERYSVSWRDSRPLVNNIWAIAGRLGVTEFDPRTKHTVKDDHLKLHSIAKIPSCDIIDFDYVDARGANLWHTEGDVARNCSGESLAKVGWVVLEWIKSEQAKASSGE